MRRSLLLLCVAAFAFPALGQFGGELRFCLKADPKTFNPKIGWGEVIHLATLNLEEKDETIVCWACHVLGTMGPAAEKAIKPLEKLKDRLANRDTGKPDFTKKMVDWALAKCHGKEANQVGAVDRSGK